MSVITLLLKSVKAVFHQYPLEVLRVQQESQYPSVMLPEHAFNLHNVPTDTNFSTDILAASEREAENAVACPVMSLLGSGTAF